jgi:hypothetical protein
MDFESYLRSFLSVDNDTRRQAEAYLNELRIHGDKLALELTQVGNTRHPAVIRIASRTLS